MQATAVPDSLQVQYLYRDCFPLKMVIDIVQRDLTDLVTGIEVDFRRAFLLNTKMSVVIDMMPLISGFLLIGYFFATVARQWDHASRTVQCF